MLAAFLASCALGMCERPVVGSDIILASATSPTAHYVKRVARSCGLKGARIYKHSPRLSYVLAPSEQASEQSLWCTYRNVWDNWQGLDLRPIAYSERSASR